MPRSPFACLLLLLLIPPNLPAQGPPQAPPAVGRIELTGLGGWQWGGGIETSVGDLRLEGDAHYGGILGFRVRPDGLVELSYNYVGTRASIEERALEPDTTLGNVGVHQIQIGGTVERLSGRVHPFGMGHLGMTIYAPERDLDSHTRFSIGLGGGVKIPTGSGRVGFRLQGRLWMTFFGSDSGFWCAAPGGCAVAVNGTALVQGEVSGGIYIVP